VSESGEARVSGGTTRQCDRALPCARTRPPARGPQPLNRWPARGDVRPAGTANLQSAAPPRTGAFVARVGGAQGATVRGAHLGSGAPQVQILPCGPRSSPFDRSLECAAMVAEVVGGGGVHFIYFEVGHSRANYTKTQCVQTIDVPLAWDKCPRAHVPLVCLHVIGQTGCRRESLRKR
jgi:hypothetical protein